MSAWTAIVGRGKGGRREVARDVADRLRERGVDVGGVLHERVDAGDVHRGYDAVDVATDRRTPLVRVSDTPEMCDYTFADGVFDTVAGWIAEHPGAVTFVEIGRLEANHKGYWPVVEARLSDPAGLLVLCVRPMVLTTVALQLPDPLDWLELPTGDDAVERFVDGLAHRVR